jgi:SecD/SecF fusion protein
MPWLLNPLFAQAAPEPSSIPWYVNVLVAVGTLFVSFFLGGYLGRKLRMPDHGWKIGLCLFTLLASVAILLMGPPLKLGIDLRGGVQLVYEVDQTKKENRNETLSKEQMENLVEAVKRRVNPGGQKEVTVRTLGGEEIEILVPEIETAEVEQIERLVSRTGALEFRILANNRDNKDLIERAKAMPLSETRVFDSAGNVVAWWVPVKRGAERVAGDAYRIRKSSKGDVMEVLVLRDIYNVTGTYLTKAEPDTDYQTGQPCVAFNFRPDGGQLFGKLTGTHLPDEQTDFHYNLAIILDGELYSAPRIITTITDRGQITGSFTREEVQELVKVLNAGSLPAALAKEPISKLYSGPTLGKDTIDKSTHAMIIACILVPLFMVWYYRFSGMVANIALALNMLILFAVMLTVNAAFTLTGFAGLALTVGMAVDNNILVFERLREELDRGATLRMAIRNAFHRAGTTIIDCNLTHLIAATVMWELGTDQIKGFAITLWLGVATSMYTSVFVARVIFDVAEKRQWLTKAKMLRLIGHTKIDFMGLAPYCIAGSILITVMAVAVSFHRGTGLFDIDFTGGTSVQALFEKPQDTGAVRRQLERRSDVLTDLAISDVHLTDEQPGLRFEIDTSQPNTAVVKRELVEVFGPKLRHNALTFNGLKGITGAAEAVPPTKETPPAKEAPPAKEQTKQPSKETSPAKSPAQEKPAKPATNNQSRYAPSPVTTFAAAKGQSTGLWAVETESVPPPKAMPRKPLPSEVNEKGAAIAETPPATLVDAFVGGSAVDLNFKLPLDYQAVEQLLTTAMESMKIVPESIRFELSNRDYVEGDRTAYSQWKLKIMLSPDKTKALLAAVEQQVAASPIFPRSNTFGAAVAGNTRLVAIYALVASWMCIIIYLWIRFQGVAFGVAAVVALVHDIFVMLGAIAISIYLAPFLGFLMIEPFKINLPIVAAFLTIIGYSVNDTIVVFDRIREVRGKDPDLTRKMVNDSTNQTLSRTLLTSFTVLLVVIVLYFWGGEALHGFAFALVVGVATGTYSSIYVAAPILLWLVGKHKEKTAA